ncbi:MAG TPA: sulfatase-like hydrolase/transferase [Phycisphaerae bacterium]|nr:sulfatase-like hydrolase/transferase [Phycisphaerae bacterium]HNU46647.1 sulfatase-like hydrolase/transferase [Phycisphaerae bacterium]
MGRKNIGAQKPAAARSAKPKATRRPKRKLAVAAVLVVTAVAASVAYRRSSPPPVNLEQLVPPGAAAGFNLLLVTLDTVRSDHLGCYGYRAAQTPTIDALAASGLQFDHAVTSTPLTLPSHTTMLTGLAPPRHGVRGNGSFHLAPQHVTLAERLKEAGYDTAAFVACFVLDARFGLDQGFDLYDFEVAGEGFDPNNLDYGERPAEAVSTAAIEWLRARNARAAAAPFFLWVHYFDAHKPYLSPFVRLPAFAGRPYDAEIAYLDSHLKRLLEELDRLALRENTLIAVVSDHGEGLGQHDEPTHGLLLYDTTLRVAFLLSSPPLLQGPIRVADRLVSLEDLCPTLADLLGVLPPPGLDGRSVLRAPADPDRAIYIETQVPLQAARCSPLCGLRRLGDKYIRAPEPEYYNLHADPDELKNLHGRRSTPVSALATRLDCVLDGFAAAGTPDGRRTVNTEELQRLATLGYVQVTPPTTAADLPDPKAMLRANNKIKTALGLVKAKRLEEALRWAREAARECPAYTDTCEAVAMICEQMNDPEGALAALRTCLALNPQAKTMTQIARLLMLLKRYDEMEETLQTAERLDPTNGVIYLLRGDRLTIEGRLAEAVAQYELALRVDEQRVGRLVRPQLEKVRAAVQHAP